MTQESTLDSLRVQYASSNLGKQGFSLVCAGWKIEEISAQPEPRAASNAPAWRQYIASHDCPWSLHEAFFEES